MATRRLSVTALLPMGEPRSQAATLQVLLEGKLVWKIPPTSQRPRPAVVSAQGIFTAKTSTCSMPGGSESISEAFAMSAAAALPDRCACRPSSS